MFNPMTIIKQATHISSSCTLYLGNIIKDNDSSKYFRQINHCEPGIFAQIIKPLKWQMDFAMRMPNCFLMVFYG